MRDINQAFKKATAPRKAWIYSQLPDATETRIHARAEFLKEFLARRPNHRLNDITVTQISGWGFGAYLLWQSVTLGWQDPGDEQRLRTLAGSLESAGAEHGGHP